MSIQTTPQPTAEQVEALAGRIFMAGLEQPAHPLPGLKMPSASSAAATPASRLAYCRQGRGRDDITIHEAVLVARRRG